MQNCDRIWLFLFIKGIEGVNRIKDGYNPATWMLETTSLAQEAALGVDFTDVYKNSELYRYVFYTWQEYMIYFLLPLRKMLKPLVTVMWLKLFAKAYTTVWYVIRRNKALIKELSTPPPQSKDIYYPTKYSRSFFTQYIACLWKQNWSYYRNPQYTAIRFFFTTIIAVIFGTLFWDLGPKM